MKTLKLTAKDFKKSDNYWSDYIGSENVADYDGHIEIEGSLGWVRFTRIKASGHILAEAGTGIEAGGGIKAGEGIEAGTGIKAGWGIMSGLSISCKLVLSFKYRLFAGVATWRDADDEDKKITCGKLEGGTVCYGEVIETGLPDEPKDDTPKEITIKGATYRLVED